LKKKQFVFAASAP